VSGVALALNPFLCNVHFDSMIADEISAGEAPSIARIMSLEAQGEIGLVIPQSVRAELLRTTTPPTPRAIASQHIFTLPVTLTAEELEERAAFINAVRGNAAPENIDADLRHVWEAAKYGGRYFITLDKRLLRRAGMILNL